MFYKFAKWLTNALLGLKYRIVRLEEEKPPRGKGFILASNHVSNWDPILIGGSLEPELYYMAKAELFRWPLGPIIRKLHAFPVQRGAGDGGAVDFAVRVVEDGHVLAIFPEGTRSKDGKLQRGKSGVSLIAAKTEADVLPAAVYFEEKGRFRSRVVISVGSLIPREELPVTDGSVPSELRETTKLIMSRIARQMERAEAYCRENPR